MGRRSSRVFGRTNVLPRVSRGDDRDHEHANAIRDLLREYAGGTAHLLSGIAPTYVQRQVAGRHDTLQIRELPGVHRYLGERELLYVGRH